MKKILILVTIIMLSLTLAVVVFAKYKTSVKGNTEIGVAKPVLELEKISQGDLNITEETKNLDYYFKVKNYDSSNQISEIQQKYTLEISTKKQDSLNHINYSLYSTNQDGTRENEVNLENNKTDEITIDGVINSEDYYKIHIDSVEHNRNINDEILVKLKANSTEI